MTRKAWAVLVAGVMVMAGCGVPGETGVVADYDGMPKDQRVDNAAQLFAPEQQHATDEGQLVEYYLQAAAGDFPGARARLAKFHAEGTGAWTAGPMVTVVRLVGRPVVSSRLAGEALVDVNLQPVGQITSDRGIVDPVVRERFTTRFQVVPNTKGSGWVIKSPPEFMYLDVKALDTFYISQPVYFWDRDGRTLVPDVRHLPRSIPESLRPDQVARWLVAGPSLWLFPAVQPWPAGVELRGRVVRDGARRVVDLSAKATDVSRDRLVAQLRWSLLLSDGGGDGLVLKVEGVETHLDTSDGFQQFNAAARPAGQRSWFCIAGGAVLPDCAEPVGSRHISALTSELNTQVTKAAITHNGTRAALVRPDDRGRPTLRVSWFDNGMTDPAIWSSVVSGAAVSRPAWLTADRTTARVGLVLVDGTLHQFNIATQKASAIPISWASGVRDGASAFAVAPDNRRIALVAGGQVYVAPLIVEQEKLSVGTPRQLPCSLRNITAVAWSQQDRLMVAGQGAGQTQLAELSIDGAFELIQSPNRLGFNQVTQLVASTDNPVGSAAQGEIKLEMNSQAHDVGPQSLEQIRVRTQATTATPSPGTAPPPVTAAFYAD